MRMSLYILRVLEYNLNEGFCLSRSAEIRQKEMPPDTGEFLYAARSGSMASAAVWVGFCPCFCDAAPPFFQNPVQRFRRIGILYNYSFPDSASLHKNFAYLLTFLLGYSIIRIIGTAWIREAIPAEILNKFYHLQSAGPEHRRGCKQFRGG